MDSKFASAKKEVLVEMVKLAQKRQLKGSKGGWKDFLGSYDKFGTSLNDPSKRSTDVLLAFLKTFSQEDDLKVFQCHSNRDSVEQLRKSSLHSESAKQRLVYLTFEHHQYPADYSFPSHEEGWFVTGRSEKSNFIHSKAMVAVDCEMVLCQDHTEALVRICAVDRNLEVKLDEFVNPDKPIADYRTEITGITAEDLDGVTCSLVDVQMSMKKLLSHGTILIGHSLHHDLCALKLDHARVIDTSYVFKYRDQPSYRRPSLNSLSKVQQSEMAKLLVHRIPVAVSSQDLHKFIPGDYTVEIKANKKVQADKYSAFANFKNQQEANEAFDKLEGNLEKDTGGRFQKLVSFHLDSSISGVLCVVKMTANNYSKEFPVPMKRLLEDDKGVGEPKKLWTENHCTELKDATSAGCNHCKTHLKEIEGLKKELSRRDEKISNLNKLIVNLEKTRIEKVRD